MRAVASEIPLAKPKLDMDLVCAVLTSERCKIAVMQHRSVTAGVDREQIDGCDCMDGGVVDCGDADLLIT
jgi:hypothetical protein